MTGTRKTPSVTELVIVDVELSDEELAFVDALAASTSTPEHEVTRSDVLRTLVESGLEHLERGVTQLPRPSA